MKVLLRRLSAIEQRLSVPKSIILGFAYLAVLSVVDFTSPSLISYTPFYMLGMAFLGWTAGFWSAALFSVISTIVTATQDWGIAQHEPAHQWIVFFNAACRLLVFCGAGWLTAKLASLTRHLSTLVRERTDQLQIETAQHKATSEQLSQANERFLQVINNINEVFWLSQLPDFRVIYVSPAYERVWGRPVDELYRNSRAWLEAVHPDDRGEIIRRMPREQPVGGYDVEYRILRPDGSTRWIRDRAFPVRDAEGNTVRVAGLAQDITDQKRTEEVLKTQAAILESMAEAVIVTDDDGMVLQMNPAAERIWGVERREVLGLPANNLRSLAHHRSARIAPAGAAKGFADSPWHGTFRDRRKDGSDIFCEAHVSRLQFQGRALNVAVEQDVTQRVYYEEQLQIQARVLEHLAEGVLMVDDSGTITLTNPAADALLGYDRAELVGQPLHRVTEMTLEEFRSAFSRDFKETQTAGSIVREYVARRKDGATVLIEFRATGLRLNSRYFVVLVGQDITERKRSSETLSRQEQLYRTLFELCPDGILLEDPNGGILDANDAICQSLGYSRNEMIGRRVDFLAAPDSASLIEEHLSALRTGGSLDHEVWNLHKNGSRRLMRLHEKLIALPDGKQGILVVARDITEQKRGELTREALLTMGTKLSTARTAVEAAQAVFDSADQLWEWDAATLNVYNPEKDQIEHVLNYDIIQGRRAVAPQVRFFKPPTPRMQRVMQSGPELILRRPADPFEPDTVMFGDTSRPAAAIMSVPLRRDGQNVGVLSLQSYTPNAYTENDLRKLQALADHCSGALYRIRAEAALRESEERYRLLAESSPDAIFILNHDLKVEFVNSAGAALWRKLPRDLIGKSQAELFPPDTARRQSAVVEQVFRTGEVVHRDVEVPYPEGRRWQDTRLAALRDSRGEITSVMGISRDITERRRAEEALRQSEERYRTVVEDQTEIISRSKPDGTLLFVNDAFCRFFGKTAGELLGSKWHPRAAAEDLPRIDAELKKLSLSNPVVLIENTVFSKTGQRHWMQFANRALFDQHGQLLEIQSVGRDLTERQRAEQALRESESKLSAIFRILPVGVSTVTADGRILDANPALWRLLKISPGTLARRDHISWKFYHSDGSPMSDDESPSQRAIKEQREVPDTEIGIEKSDGTRIWVSVNAAPLPGMGAVVSTVDITERKRAEFLLRAQRDLAGALSSTSDLTTAAGRLLQICLQIEGVDGGSIYLSDTTTDALDLTAHHLSAESFAPPAHLPPDSDEARVATTGRPAYLEQSSVAAGGGHIPLDAGSGAAALVPLSHAGITLGLVILYSRRQQQITAESRPIIETLANEAATAIARMRAEDALHQSEARLRAFITAAPVLLFACDKNGVITLEDGLALKALNVEPGKRVGQSVFEVFAQNPAILENVHRALRGEEFNSLVEIGPHALDCWYSPLRDRSGHVVGFNGVATNVSERFRLERQILEISDREQARIGQDIHDGLCQHLVTLAFDANSLQGTLARRHHAEAPRAARIARFLDEAITEARHLARGLFPVRLESEGLSSALQELANTTRSRFNVQCHFRSREKVVVPNTSIATHLYRIAQESVNNAIRHANAKTISITLHPRQSELELRITDDGSGFSPNSVKSSRGMGLHIMDYRARTLNGRLQFNPRPDGGTTVSCCIPRPALS